MRKIHFIIVFYAFVAIFSSNIMAQQFELGWKGTDILQKDLFTDNSKWDLAYTKGDSCYLTTDSANIYLHWSFGPGARKKSIICKQILNNPIQISDKLIGVDIKGSICNDNRHVKLGFEDTKNEAYHTWHGLASLNRWFERLSLLKEQFKGNINWNEINAIKFEVFSDSSANDTLEDSGVLVIRKLQLGNPSEWQRINYFETLIDSSILDTIKNQAIKGILARQVPNGLFYTWKEDPTSWLYGHGMLLKLLSIEGEWENSLPINDCAKAAEKLALFFVENQDSIGFWPRAWYTESGKIKWRIESYGEVFMGDFPWVITGLVNYYAKSGDKRVLNSISRAKAFLYNLIEEDGSFYTLNVIKNTKVEITSSELYSSAIQSLYELGDTAKAAKLLNYISSKTWDSNLKYWREGIHYPAIILFANTWLSQLSYISHDYQKAYDALSFVGKALYTKGSGEPDGFDGIGPVATWFEGTLTYICAGGPGSQELFYNLVQYRNPDGTVPAYNDNIGGKVDVWAVNWSSLDGTIWLYFAASKSSPFKIYYKSNLPD
ncbi:MAG: hypothetical protein IPM71_00380 [Bacteroidota bacterium]|nr:MAG: hypothetical protein IPM71_00380 [Bacteroidota bacterium]